MNSEAPFYADLADGPATGHALWLRTEDGVRIRMAVWPEGTKGTILLFPGRTEYVEKYGRAAAELAARGFAMIAIDWRGQGLSDRHLRDTMSGHVHEFNDYQKDLRAVLKKMDELDLPEPHYLIAHSMGGCIGLRALMDGLHVKAAAFSAPMWGIGMSPKIRPFAKALSGAGRVAGLGHIYTPGTKRTTFVADAPYDDNVLTTDPEMLEWMRSHALAHPELTLGGPSLHWLNEALIECDALEKRPSPDVPTLTALGTNERIVDCDSVRARMARWPKGRLEMFEKAEHEVMMEVKPLRDRFFDEVAALFSANP
jgi:lysophospholipase